VSEVNDITAEYPVVQPICSSERSTVYASQDPHTDKPVVVKLIVPGSSAEPTARQRFLRSLGALHFLRLTGFPLLLDYGFSQNDSAFIVMEPVKAPSLKQLVSPEPGYWLPLLIQTAQALESLSRSDVAHQNLCPDNILVANLEAGTPTVKVVGFGTAAYRWSSPGQARRDLYKQRRYTAPELLDADTTQIDFPPSCDLYSLARLTCELCGIRISSLKTTTPELTFPISLKHQLSSTLLLKAALESALCPEPQKRDVGYADLITALRAAQPKQVLLPTSASGDKSNGLVPKTVKLPRAREKGVSARQPTPPSSSKQVVSSTPPPLPPPLPKVRPSQPTVKMAAHPPQLPQVHMHPTAVPEPSRQPSRQRPSQHRWVLPLICTAATMLMLTTGLIAVLLLRHNEEPKLPPSTTLGPPPTAQPVLEEEPTQPEHPQLAHAQELVSQGDTTGARQVLDSLSEDELAALSEDERRWWKSLSAQVEGSGTEQAVKDLGDGLSFSSIPMLKRAVPQLANLGKSDLQVLGITSELEHAQQALALHQQLWRNRNTKSPLLLMQHATALAEALPRYKPGLEMREQAAAQIEATARSASTLAEYDRALSTLDQLQQLWPERGATAQTIAEVTAARQQAQRTQGIVQEALHKGESGNPEAGLALLDGLDHSRAATARAKLTRQLEQLDAATPTLTLDPHSSLEFKKRHPAILVFSASDDHRVSSVTVWVKLATCTEFTRHEYQTLSAGSYKVTVTPDEHGNDDVSVYVEARDSSGHVGSLGTSKEPLVLKRRRLFGK